MPKKKVAKASKPKKKTPNTAKKKSPAKKVAGTAKSKKAGSKTSRTSSVKNKRNTNTRAKKPARKRTAPRLVSKRQEPRKMPSQKTSPMKMNDIPNTTVALLAVLTLVFMLWSTAVFYSEISSKSPSAPTLETAGIVDPGADVRFRVNPEPRSTAVIGLTIIDEIEYYNESSNE